MDPINYITNVRNPFEQAMSGFGQGFQMGNAIIQQRAAMEQAQAQAEAQKQMQVDLANVTQNPNATAEDYARIAFRYPQLGDRVDKIIGQLGEKEKQVRLQQASEVFSAVHSGQPQVAIDLLKQQAEAARNAGREQDAKSAETLMKMVEISPESAKTSTAVMLARAMGADKFQSTYGELLNQQRASEKAPYDVAKSRAEAIKTGAEADKLRQETQFAPEEFKLRQAKTQAEIKNLGSQIDERSGRLALDRDKLMSDTQLKLEELQQKTGGPVPEYVAKEVNQSALDAVTAKQSADRMEGLAAKIDQSRAQLGSGVTAKAGEMWKKTFGSQNELTQIRSEYSRLVTPAMMAQYKKVASGSTSDRDIDTAMAGVPADTAEPEVMASFLRGVAKLQRMDEVANNAKSEWLTSNGNLGKLKSDQTIDGVVVPAGTTYTNFLDQYLPKKLGQKDAASAQTAVPGRSYMKYGVGK